ncbi:oxidoreductase C-terminal domain-containing protein [Streptomyces sp. NPDC016172]|uniref:oxidoreductase C-terminal domain-containing protein n=1 Tax=Streptomyces sp. NPDC016172 TaxID=3364964 RepID=UPI003702ABFC
MPEDRNGGPVQGQARLRHQTLVLPGPARQVGRNLLAAPKARRPFAPVPYFWSDQYGTRIQAYGFLRGHDEVAVVEGDLAGRRFVAAYRRGDRLTGALAMGMPPRAVRAWRQAIAGGAAWREAVGTAAA